MATAAINAAPLMRSSELTVLREEDARRTRRDDGGAPSDGDDRIGLQLPQLLRRRLHRLRGTVRAHAAEEAGEPFPHRRSGEVEHCALTRQGCAVPSETR